MTKITKEAREYYLSSIAPFAAIVQSLSKKEVLVLDKLRKNESQYTRLELVNDYLCAVSQYLVMNSLSISMLGIKNDNALNDARKSCFKAVIELEKVFTNYLDVPFADYKAALEATSDFPELKRYALIRKTCLAIDLLQEALGESNKWKWALIEMQGRLAVVAKNTLNLKTLIKELDPRTPHYQERVKYLNIVRKMLQDASDKYRLKYEGVTGQIVDFQMAISYIAAMRRLSMMLERNTEAENLKRKIEVWGGKLNKDIENKDKNMRMRQIQSTNAKNE